MKIVFATHNQGKIVEMREILRDLNIEILSSKEVGITADIVEDGITFEENAYKKAKFVSEETGLWSIADDSGICIEALGGKPGVFSARWAGEDASDIDIVNYTLQKMKNVPKSKRLAWFETSAVLCSPQGKHWSFKGIIKGAVPDKPFGNPRSGLPYDVIFIPEGFDITFAQMTDEQKNSLSHRGEAFRKMRGQMQAQLLEFSEDLEC